MTWSWLISSVYAARDECAIQLMFRETLKKGISKVELLYESSVKICIERIAEFWGFQRLTQQLKISSPRLFPPIASVNTAPAAAAAGGVCKYSPVSGCLELCS